MTSQTIACVSRIERVVVYSRGAIVTRRVELPEALPAEGFEIAVGGVTALAEVGSFRAIVGEGDAAPAAGGAREVLGVRARLVVPAAPVEPGVVAARVREIELAGERLATERNHLRWRRELLGGVTLEPELVRRLRPLDPAARIGDALAVGELVAAELGGLDGRIAGLDEAIAANGRELSAARVAAAQATSGEIEDAAPARLEVVVRFAPGAAAAGPGPGLRLEYAVLAARWWPAYAARFSRGATRVTWQIDAFVAQASGEDWRDVSLALSTADLVQDTRLPELASLRLGRAQRPPRRGYRPAPEGLDAMFEGFDRFVAAAPKARRTRALEATRPEPAPSAGPVGATSLIDADDEPTGAYANAPAVDSLRAKVPVSRAPARAAAPASDMRAQALAMPLGGMAPGYGGGAPPQQERLKKEKSAVLSRAPASETGTLFTLEEGAVYDAPAEAEEAEAEADAAVEPADAWLDFDALRLAGAGDDGRRGRLARDGAPRRPRAAERARSAVDEIAAPPRAVDPRGSRGQFDHQYAAAGTVDVPSSARPHRVTLSAADAPATPRFVTVPREAAEVYREARVDNPFDAPLLAGPVEIFVDGALTAQSVITQVDRGGIIRAGLGVEDRLRVARNARVDESSAGLLGGSLAVEHAVTIDIASSLGRSVDVEVVDRVPVTDDKDMDVKLLSAQPKPQPYTQAETGHPVRKGLRWVVPVPAGGRAAVAFTYRITLPAKNEIIGGNRRE